MSLAEWDGRSFSVSAQVGILPTAPQPNVGTPRIVRVIPKRGRRSNQEERIGIHVVKREHLAVEEERLGVCAPYAAKVLQTGIRDSQAEYRTDGVRPTIHFGPDRLVTGASLKHKHSDQSSEQPQRRRQTVHGSISVP
jgi:hypothetical protein